MSAVQPMADLVRLGIRIEAHGDPLRYSVRSTVTPDLADRMKAHKREPLGILQGDPEACAAGLDGAGEVRQAALEPLERNPPFLPEVLEAARLRDNQGSGNRREYD